MNDTALKPWRRASDHVKYLALSWELCPPEILCMILKNLNGKALLVCMAVSRRWKDIVMDYIECHDLWEKIVLEEMVNLGRTFQRKSTLNYKEILINSKLWHSVNEAQINLYYIYSSEDFIKMRVYKDNLILLMDNIISYFDIKEKKLRMLNDSPINLCDYCENDHMAAIMEQFEGYEADLRVYGKSHPDDYSFNESSLYIMNG
uniref:F-box domain-containing protein n=1 Tax=Heliothis virescens TaxID=7102 RepID=A0A2A4J4X5_HELVI